MKIKSFLFTALAALTGLGAARAEHTDSGVLHIYLTGSTAYRGNTVSALLHKIGGTAANGAISTTISAGRKAVWDNTLGGPASIDKATRLCIYTTVPADFGVSGGGVTAVMVKVYWGGSVGGIKNVAGSETAVGAFIDDSVVTAATDGVITSSTSPSATDTSITDFSMSDTFQSSTPFTGTVTLNDGTYASPNYNDHTYASLVGAASGETDGIVGVVPFVWLKSYCSNTTNNFNGVTNITPSLVQKLWAGSHGTTMAQFSGTSTSADLANVVLPTGRDPDSGTRLTAYAEGGLGAFNLSVLQRQPTDGGTNVSGNPVSAANYYFPSGTVINGINCDPGQSGEASGGTLVKLLNLDTTSFTIASGHPATFVTYAGSSDAKSGLTNAHPCTALTWNGVSIDVVTPDYTNLLNGKYSFWGYEHMYYRSGASTQCKAAADSIAVRIHDNDAQILMTAMKCKRDGDGTPVYPNYAY